MQPANSVNDIDANSSAFYDKLQDEIENNLTRLKKNVIIITKLRMAASEMEVEIAALYHAQLWHELEEAKHYISNVTNLTTFHNRQ